MTSSRSGRSATQQDRADKIPVGKIGGLKPLLRKIRDIILESSEHSSSDGRSSGTSKSSSWSGGPDSSRDGAAPLPTQLAKFVQSLSEAGPPSPVSARALAPLLARLRFEIAQLVAPPVPHAVALSALFHLRCQSSLYE